LVLLARRRGGLSRTYTPFIRLHDDPAMKNPYEGLET
jgi:hypothetical protein